MVTMRTTRAFCFFCTLALLAAESPAAERRSERPTTLRDPHLYYLQHSDESVPLRQMPIIPPEDGHRRVHGVKLLHPPLPILPGSADTDPVRQRRVALPMVGTTAGLSFDGVGVGLGSFSPSSAPPDTNGAPGATQYVQWVNTSFAVFDKATGALTFGPAAGSTLWQGFGGPCQNNNDGDPVVAYDEAAGRWVMTQFSIRGGQFFQCVAVSTTSDATGTYRRFAFQFEAFNDYPKLGVWPDAYYMTFNIFNAQGTAFLGGRACALDRSQMITASGTPAAMQCFQTTAGGLLPADLDGPTPPPAGSPNFVVALGANALQLWRFHVSFSSPGTSTFSGPTQIPVAAFSEACGGGTCIPQGGTSTRLDSLADRLMHRAAYRNFGDHESLVTNHSVSAGSTPSGARWYEIRGLSGTPSVFQQGTFTPDASSRWMGSIAMDRAGNMALGYSASSAADHPSIRFTGRTQNDPLGAMESEATIINGGGSQTGSLTRWGDYSNMAIDPADDCTFWYTSEYLKANGSFNWSTRIASFRFPSCSSGSVTGPEAFDAQFYLSLYPDLQAAFGNDLQAATNHWLQQGLPNEGRRGARHFDVRFYLAQYPDLQAAFGTNYRAAADHWVSQGLPIEGRRGAREFDVRYYLGRYSDLSAAFGTNYSAALNHWIVQGLPNEGRRGSRELDVSFYLGTYPDLLAAFGQNYTRAMDHWIMQGLPHEGRRGSRELDISYYLGRYSDLAAAFGADYPAAMNHWIVQGLPHEGRRGSREVDVSFYLARYADLAAAFGQDYPRAIDHWTMQGLPVEGRRGSREFDVAYYLSIYPDLRAAFGTNYQAAIDHWIAQGLPNEGRRGSRELDVRFYLAAYADLAAAFGQNYPRAIDHWTMQGLPVEGRRGSQDFDVRYYLSIYPDLQAAFGTNYLAATDHWIIHGFAEGRHGAP
jgi:phage terminase Nu1 subunit (DNA packaging protein)